MLSLFLATHWSDHIVWQRFTSNSLFVMTALPCWLDLTQARNPERLPDGWKKQNKKTQNPAWHGCLCEWCASAGSLFHVSERCHVSCGSSGRKRILSKRKLARQAITMVHTARSVGGKVQLSSGEEHGDGCLSDWYGHLARGKALQVCGTVSKSCRLSCSSLFLCQGHFGNSNTHNTDSTSQW